MRKPIKKLGVLLITCSMALTGCDSFIREDATSYPLVNAITTQEIVDYYAKALQYDTIVSRNVKVHDTTYETKEVVGDKTNILKDLVSKAETILSKDEYEFSTDNSNIMSEDTYNYVKHTIDNEVLTNGNIVGLKGALGYYFVDVQYDITPKEPGKFNSMTSMLGLDGAFITQYDGSYTIDNAYLQTTVNKLNEYYFNNKIMKVAAFDSGTGIITVANGTPILPNNAVTTTQDQAETSQNVDTQTAETETAETETDSNTEGTEGTEGTEEQINEDTPEDVQEPIEEIPSAVEAPTTETGETGMKYNSITLSDRKVQLDTNEINTIAGSSLAQSAYMPELNTVYEKPAAEGTMSGFGIYNAGGNGLRYFGFDRSKLAGTIQLRYVFKDNSDGSGTIHGTNIYCIEETITNGFNISDQNVLIPDFLLSQFKQLIERADRAQVNYDLSALMSGKIYEDIGFGVLRGYKESSTNTLKYMSTIRQVIARDTENNAYLVEVETTIRDGAKEVDCYGTYRDKSYVVIQQQGTEFKIVDQIRMSREMSVEPTIYPDSATKKRLVALNLVGEISEQSQSEISTLMSELYTAGTNRILNGPKEVTIDGKTVTINKGMYDCFNSDTTMLSSDSLEYANSQLRGALIKYGNNVSSLYSGTVTEWIGGYDNQAEFTTEELVTYAGKKEGYYMQVYYLVSKMNDTWVIDERTIMDNYEVSEADLDNIKQRVGQ